MKITAIATALLTLSVLITFAAPPTTPAEIQYGPNKLLEDKADIEINLKEANARLNAVVEKLSSKYQGREAEDFAKAQAAWIAWRDAEAAYMTHRYAPTSESSPDILVLAFEAIKSSNKLQMTQSRVKQLEEELSRR